MLIFEWLAILHDSKRMLANGFPVIIGLGCDWISLIGSMMIVGAVITCW